MKPLYRLTVRFHLDDDKARRAAEFLMRPEDGKSRNRIVIEAINAYIDKMESDKHDDELINNIRKAIHEELSGLKIQASGPVSSDKPVLTEVQETENADSVLDFLDGFN